MARAETVEKVRTAVRSREERDEAADGGMPALIRVREQRLSVRCPLVNEPVSPRYQRDPGRDAVEVGEKGAAANLTTGMR